MDFILRCLMTLIILVLVVPCTAALVASGLGIMSLCVAVALAAFGVFALIFAWAE